MIRHDGTATRNGDSIAHDHAVRAALHDVRPQSAPPPHASRVWSRLGSAAGAIGVVVAAFVVNRRFWSETALFPWVDKTLLAAGIVLVVFAVEQAVEAWLLVRVHDGAARYNLKRVLRLVMALAMAAALVKLLFVNWYAAAASLGIASLLLGFALQTPITSFIGWIYILARNPFRVGDRIRIGEAMGEVIDVSYLDTTLWELGGELTTGDQPSGRVIKFPNSTVLQNPVYNYSWPLFPYVWNEVKLAVAYESDLELVARVLREVAESELGHAVEHDVATYRSLLAQTPVDARNVHDKPTVSFRASDNTWIEAIVRYLVEPHAAAAVRSSILKTALARLNETPERVMFPKGNSR